jgi:hypothetical protein
MFPGITKTGHVTKHYRQKVRYRKQSMHSAYAIHAA